MIAVEILHDALQDGLHNAVRDKVDSVLARASFNLGDLPPNQHTAAIIKAVLTALANLPGEHWLPDDGGNT